MKNDTYLTNIMRFAFGLIILVILAGLIAGMFFVAIPQGNENTLGQLQGTVATLAGLVIGYLFGTSASSNAKNQLLDKALDNKPTGTPNDPVYVETDTAK